MDRGVGAKVRDLQTARLAHRDFQRCLQVRVEYIEQPVGDVPEREEDCVYYGLA
jgi:hypothetical protein